MPTTGWFDRRRTGRRAQIVGMALLRGVLAALLLAIAVPTTAMASSDGLYDCGTSHKGRVGNGWCSGTGMFRILVSCADGKTVKSPWVRVTHGKGTLGVTCQSLATGVEIDKRANP
jgi:hypothetical protein